MTTGKQTNKTVHTEAKGLQDYTNPGVRSLCTCTTQQRFIQEIRSCYEAQTGRAQRTKRQQQTGK